MKLCNQQISIAALLFFFLLLSEAGFISSSLGADFSYFPTSELVLNSVNGDGTLTVGFTPSPNRQAYLRKQDGTYVNLGSLKPGGESEANGISGDGSVVVGSASGLSGTEAFRWTSSGGMGGLGDLSGGSFFSTALNVSDDGKVVVGRGASALGQEAFRWSSETGMVGLGDLPGGFFASEAQGVNADGSVIVGDSFSANGKEAFRWTAATGMVALGDFAGGGDHNSTAVDVSADGSVVAGTGETDQGFDAFKWTAETGMVSLGQLPGGSTSSTASAISGNGAIIVGLANTPSGNEVFRWSQNAGMQSLNTLLKEEGVALDGFNLYQLSDISDDGTVIVGVGEDPDGKTVSWIAKYDDGFVGLTTFEDVNKSLEDLSTLTPRISGMSLLTLRSLLESQRYSEDSLTSFWGLGTFGSDFEFSGDDINGYGALGMTHFWRSGWSFGGGVFVGNTTVESSFGGRQNSTLIGPGIFVGYMPAPTGLQIKVGAMYNYVDLELDRAYSNGTGTTSSDGDTEGHVLGGVAYVAWLFALQNMFIVQPFFQYEVQEIKINKYEETTGPLPAKYDSRYFVTNKTRLVRWS